MNWDIFAENINQVILAAIEHGGDAGGPYFSCPSKLKHEMEKLLYMTPNFVNYYRIGNIYSREFLTEIPQFIKL